MGGWSKEELRDDSIRALGEYGIQNRTNDSPYRLSIKLCKVGNGGMTRYMRVYREDGEITQMIANITGWKVSKAKDTYGCVIVHGCGMDMAFHLVNTVGRVVNYRYPDAIDTQYYKLIEK